MSRQTRAVPLAAHQQHDAGRVHIESAVFAFRRQPPFEHVQADHQSAGEISVASADRFGSNVHHQGSGRHHAVVIDRFDTIQTGSGILQESFEGCQPRTTFETVPPIDTTYISPAPSVPKETSDRVDKVGHDLPSDAAPVYRNDRTKPEQKSP